MFANYLASALNNLLKNRLFSVINIVGLALGLGVCMLIALYVQDELSYDRHWPDAQRIYRLNASVNFTGDGFVRKAASQLKALPSLKQYFPEVVEQGARQMIPGAPSEIEWNNAHFEERIIRVDAAIASMFGIEQLRGNLETTLADPNKIALREDVAKRIFGDEDPLGSVLNVTLSEVTRQYEVGAVFRLPAGNTVLDLPTMTLLNEAIIPPFVSNWDQLATHTWVKLAPGADLAALEARLPAFTDDMVDIAPLMAGPGVLPSQRMRFDLQPVSDIHLNSPFDDTRKGGSKTAVVAFSAIAAFVLVIGLLNFTILSTAKATRRAREVAVRKTLGASRHQLVIQFLGEAFILVLFAMMCASMLLEIALPVFEALVGKRLTVDWFSSATLLSFSFLLVITGTAGGLYPAFVLSRFRPAATLGARMSAESPGSLKLRNLLVAFQFGISIALITATAAIYLQVRYSMERDPGFNKDNLLVIDNFLVRPGVVSSKETLKQEILKLDGVNAAALSTHQPGQLSGFADIPAPFSLIGSSAGSQSLAALAVDDDFLPTYQIPLLAGRNFIEGRDLASHIFENAQDGERFNVIINASAVRQFGFATAEEAIGRELRVDNSVSRVAAVATIIGVAADTNFRSLRAVPRPEVYLISPGFIDVLTVRYSGNPQTLLQQIEAAWRSVMGDEQLSIGFVEQNLAREFTQERSDAAILLGFSLLAIVIACLGLYGSVVFTVDRRTKEIGIRKVMGAEVRQIVALLLWQFSKPILLANLLAWPVAFWAILNWLQRFPYRIDSLVLIPLCVFSGVIVLSLAWLTAASNTLRVAGAKPVLALRYE